MADLALTFEIELLEDMHAGTGLGRLGRVDDTHSRDRAGRPIVWASTFRGLLREAGRDWIESLKRVGLPHADHERRLTRLLGSYVNADTPAGTVIRSLRVVGAASEGLSDFLVWASTARAPHSRRPDDKMLRFVEFARAGLRFAGEIRLRADAPAEDVTFLKECLRRVPSLGGSKTRGWGRIHLACNESATLPSPAAPALPATMVADRPVTLRLLLRNLEPLNLARTAFAGNLIGGQHFIPGSALRGALLHWLHNHGHGSSAERLGGVMQVGNAYVVPGEPDGLPTAWEQLEVLPLPLSLREPKGGRAAVVGAVPWWASPEEMSDCLQAPAWDALAVESDATVPHQKGDKRIKSEEYLVRAGDGDARWRRVRPEVAVLLRNTIPTERLDPTGKDPVRDDDSALFSEEVLREDQCFLAELRFDRGELAAEFLRAVAPLLEGERKTRSWLRIGRKGRPVMVAGWCCPAPAAAVEASRDHLTLTLTSDLIARSHWLSFETELEPATLARLAQDAGGEKLEVDGLDTAASSTSEPVEVYGYNSATGLPRAPALAIRRGSVLRLTAQDDAGRANLARWRGALRKLCAAGVGLGERTDDGFGRFILDLDIHEPGYWRPARQTGEGREVFPDNWREAVLERVEQFLRAHDGRPSVSQWQWVRNSVKAFTELTQLDTFLGELGDKTKLLGTRRQWEGLVEPLVKAVKEAGDTLAARQFFLDMLVQRVVAGKRRNRKKEGRQ